MAIDEFRAMRLTDLAQQTGCGFGIDEARPELLTIGGPSVTPLMNLASEIVASVLAFRKPRSPRDRKHREGNGVIQQTLDPSPSYE